MTTPRIKEIEEEYFDNTFKWVDLENGLGQYLLMSDVAKHLEPALTKAHQAGIDEAVEVVKQIRDTESEMSFKTWERERHYATGVLERTIKALQDNK